MRTARKHRVSLPKLDELDKMQRNKFEDYKFIVKSGKPVVQLDLRKVVELSNSLNRIYRPDLNLKKSKDLIVLEESVRLCGLVLNLLKTYSWILSRESSMYRNSMSLICKVFEKACSVDCLDMHFSHPFETKYTITNGREMSDLISNSMDRVSLHRVVFSMAIEIDELNLRLNTIRGEYDGVIGQRDGVIVELREELRVLQKAPEKIIQVDYLKSIGDLERELVASVKPGHLEYVFSS